MTRKQAFITLVVAMLLAAALLFQSQTAKEAKKQAAKEAAPESAPAKEQAKEVQPGFYIEADYKDVKVRTVSNYPPELEKKLRASMSELVDAMAAANRPQETDYKICAIFGSAEPDKYIGAEKMAQAIKDSGYKLGTFQDLYELALEIPDAGNDFPIVALGTEIPSENPEIKEPNFPTLGHITKGRIFFAGSFAVVPSRYLAVKVAK